MGALVGGVATLGDMRIRPKPGLLQPGTCSTALMSSLRVYSPFLPTGLFTNIPVPAYLADHTAFINFSSICDKAAVQAHPRARQILARLSRVQVRDINKEALIHDLMMCTTLDKPQAAALIAGMTQEFSLIQGPPGTGTLLLFSWVAAGLWLCDTSCA